MQEKQAGFLLLKVSCKDDSEKKNLAKKTFKDVHTMKVFFASRLAKKVKEKLSGVGETWKKEILQRKL